MTTSTIRKKLITYLADADDSKVKAIYTLLEDDIRRDEISFTDELERERELHLSGQTKSYSRTEAIEIIKGQHSF
ncbi:hypothetical protein [Mucilaginibacter flavidus]|uniref:hypothetical protein n=1 Tax=Mucilaginibacter flavidus TaxID=2949309 RepID=UPI0020922137|nr:hypothetical protein [Mucilaginibacter flavidus]MCO5947362.1 hypothetical protein [Mucilaginibacter flavidus]